MVRHGLCLDNLNPLQALLDVTVVMLLSPVLSLRASSYPRAGLVGMLLCPSALGLKLTLGLDSALPCGTVLSSGVPTVRLWTFSVGLTFFSCKVIPQQVSPQRADSCKVLRAENVHVGRVALGPLGLQMHTAMPSSVWVLEL